ncbi:MAG: SsrA-binding protein SmpB [bacterium]
MAKGTPPKESHKIVAQNRKARHDYHILDVFQAGIVLTGSEVKAIREGGANFKDSYAAIERGELFLLECHISPYSHGGYANHEPTRPRKLLMHKREIMKLFGKLQTRGLTLVPLRMYFVRGKVKVDIALAQGKKQYDKREDIKKRDIDREMRHADKYR